VRVNCRPQDQKLTEAELRAVQQLAVEFTTRFVRNKDLAPGIKDLFSKDFIERYLNGRSKALGALAPSDLDFVPGLFYNSRLHTEASREDWLQFYTAANNFLFLGIMSGIKTSPDVTALKPADLYPSSVIKLLDTNPNLSNMIMRKGSSRVVSSVEEMRKATAVLEQAASLMRQQPELQRLKADEAELLKAIREEAFFKPTVRTIDDQFFGYPKGTQIVVINTPVLFRLLIVKANDSFEILWAEPVRGN
jgi:hypothetical protein